jgi:hypothetical protein
MKKFNSVAAVAIGLTLTIGGALALIISYFGWDNVEVVLWSLSLGSSYVLGRYHASRDMVSGAKLAVAAQESDDRRERAGLSALGSFMTTIKAQQPTQPAQAALPSPDVSDAELLFEDSDFMLLDE